MTDDPRPYRNNVLGVFLDEEGRVLAMRRGDRPEAAWQLPQGGVEDGETPEDAVVREMSEELGLDPGDISVLHRFPQRLCYDFPPEMTTAIARKHRGQIQDVFLLRMAPGAGPVLSRSDGEAAETAYVDFIWLAAQVVSFKREAYRRLEALLAAWRNEGG